MSWGAYWMFYVCPRCGKKFRSATDTITDPSFGRCPLCFTEGELMGESGKSRPPSELEYEDTY